MSTEPATTSPQTEERAGLRAHPILTAALIVVLLALVAVAVVLGIAESRSGIVLEGVSVEGVELSGLGRDDAREELAPLAGAYGSEPVTFEVPLGLEDVVLRPSEVEAGVDVDALIDRALSVGRDRAFPERVRATLLGVEPVDLDVEVDVVELNVVDWAEGVPESRAVEPTTGELTLQPEVLTVETVQPEPGLSVDAETLAEQATQALRTRGAETLELPSQVLDPLVEPAAIEATAEQIRSAIAEPLVLTGGGEAIVLEREEVARLITPRIVGSGTESEFVLAVTTDAVSAVLSERVEPLLTSPTNADLEAPRSPPARLDDQGDVSWSPVPASVSVVPSEPGTQFDPEEAATQLRALLRDGVREAELRLAVRPADVTTQDAENWDADFLLSTFTTYHPCCAARVANIQRLAEVVDDTLVLPGEQFSINSISGERTCGKGYVEDGMILRGEIVDVCGGGVSQFGTTTANAVFFAGIDPDAYKPHSFYISRYPPAREATLNYPNLDVAFTNPFDSGILVRTTYSSTSITVSFYGNSNVERVVADHGASTNFRSFETERRINRDLAPGTEQVEQGGRDGFYAPLTRTTVYESGEVDTDDWGFAYVPEREIIEYNPG